MNLLAHLRAAVNWTGRQAKNLGGKVLMVPEYLSGLLWLLSQGFVDLARNGYGGNSAVYACLRLLSTAVPEPQLRLYSHVASGPDDQDVELPDDHPLVRLIRQPNELLTEYEFWELMTLHLAITGRSVWFKERNMAGEVIALWPLRPDRVGPIYSDTTDSSGTRVISGWSYLLPGTTSYIPIPRRDTLFVNFPDGAGDSGGIVEGLGPLQVLAAEVGSDNEATRYVGSLLANHGAPGVVLQVQNGITSLDDVKLIKNSFASEFGGAKRGSPAVVDAGTKVDIVGFNLQQLEFPALRRVAESRIAATVGTPAILVGLMVGLEAGIRATVTEMREYFTETTCSGYWRRYQDVVMRDLASEWSAAIIARFDMSQVKALQMQDAKDKEVYLGLFQAGVISYDELRAKHGLPPLKSGGDRRVLPRGSIEIDVDGNVVETGGQMTGPAPAADPLDHLTRLLGGADPARSAPAQQGSKPPPGTGSQAERDRQLVGAA